MVDHELNELRREFLDEAREKVDEMEAAARSLESSENVERVAYLAHQLKGSGGSYGYQSISENAAEIEKAAEILPATNGTHAEIEEKIRAHVGLLLREIEQASAELA